MIKSVAGKYRDVVSMSPVVNINADKLSKIWHSVVKVITNIGFDSVLTMADGHRSNIRFYEYLSSSSEGFTIKNPYA